MIEDAYKKWQADQTPESLAAVISELEPSINAEIHRYAGPKPLLRGQAKQLAIGAIRSYDPAQGAQLRSWVTTQLQPLSRYSASLKPVKIPEVAARQAAEINRLETELADELGYNPSVEELADKSGISVRRIQKLKQMVRPVVAEGTLQSTDTDEGPVGLNPAVDTVRSMSGVEEAAYESLSPRDKQIFDMKTGKHGQKLLSNQEIATRLGVTPALISQRTQTIAQTIQRLNETGLL